MKKYFYILIASVALLSVTISCTKEENGIEDTTEQPADVSTPSVPLTISASIPEEGLTKVSLEQDSDPDGVVKLTWTDKDFITVKNAADESKSVIFEYASGAGTATATFSADDASALDGATSYNVYLSSNLPADYNNQTQASDGSTVHLGYSASVKDVNKYDGVIFSSTWAGASENGSGSFASSSVLRVRAQMPTATIADAVQAVIIKADKNIFAGKDSIRVEMSEGVEGDSRIVTVYATLPPETVNEVTTTKLLFQFQKSADKNDRLTAYRELPTLSLNSGEVNAFKINCPNIESFAGTADDGTAEHPYLIGDRNQLAAVSGLLSTTEKKYFKLVDNIKVVSWSNIDCKEKGSIDFDGDNKTITGLTSPFFSVLVGKVYDLTLSDVTVPSGNYYGALVRTINGGDCEITKVSASGSAAGTGNQRGGLIGRIESTTNSCVLINCSANVTVSGGQNIGGLVGYVNFDATFKDCFATGNVSGSQYYIGGLIGQLKDGTLNNCHASSGTVASSADVNYSHIGGLVGNMVGGSLNKCFSTDDVEGKGYNVGGLVGSFAGGSIKKCYSGGKVKSTHTVVTRNNRVGGFIGAITAASLEVSDSYSTGTVTGNANCGGFIGYCDKNTTITNGYTTSSVDATDPGALIGNHADGTISGSGFIAWWASGNMVGTGDAHSLTTSYLGNTDSIYSQAVALGGWDFINVWTTDATPTLR